jgi:hypothetical protein
MSESSSDEDSGGVALLPDATRCIAPRVDHEWHCGTVDDSAGDGSEFALFSRMVRFDDGTAYVVPERRVVSASGYAEALLDWCGSAPDTRTLRCSIWRAEIWVEGLWSMVFWALGFLEAEVRSAAGPPTRLLIDWTDDNILFHPAARGRRVPANAWNVRSRHL